MKGDFRDLKKLLVRDAMSDEEFQFLANLWRDRLDEARKWKSTLIIPHDPICELNVDANDNTSMIPCAYCRSRNKSDSTHCASCGAPIKPENNYAIWGEFRI